MPRLVGPADRGLTSVQRAILDFVLEYTRSVRYSPSYSEIGDAVRLKTSSAVSYQLGILQTMGYLSRQPGRPRSIAVTALYRRDPSAASAGDHDDDVAYVPLVGRIAAGGPILAFEDIEENLPLPRSRVGHGDLIALRVRGDSMTGAGINHGDVVVIRKQSRVEIGENAAAMIRDEVTGDFEATVKEYRVYDGHTGSCRITLPTRPSPRITPRLSERSRPSCVAACEEGSAGRAALSRRLSEQSEQ